MLLPWVSIVPTDAQFWLSNNKMVVSEWAKHFFFGSIVCKNNNYQPQEKFYALHHHSNCKICRMTLSQQVLKINVRFIKKCYSARLFILYINDKNYIFFNKY